MFSPVYVGQVNKHVDTHLAATILIEITAWNSHYNSHLPLLYFTSRAIYFNNNKVYFFVLLHFNALYLNDPYLQSGLYVLLFWLLKSVFLCYNSLLTERKCTLCIFCQDIYNILFARTGYYDVFWAYGKNRLLPLNFQIHDNARCHILTSVWQ